MEEGNLKKALNSIISSNTHKLGQLERLKDLFFDLKKTKTPSSDESCLDRIHQYKQRSEDEAEYSKQLQKMKEKEWKNVRSIKQKIKEVESVHEKFSKQLVSSQSILVSANKHYTESVRELKDFKDSCKEFKKKHRENIKKQEKKLKALRKENESIKESIENTPSRGVATTNAFDKLVLPEISEKPEISVPEVLGKNSFDEISLVDSELLDKYKAELNKKEGLLSKYFSLSKIKAFKESEKEDLEGYLSQLKEIMTENSYTKPKASSRNLSADSEERLLLKIYYNLLNLGTRFAKTCEKIHAVHPLTDSLLVFCKSLKEISSSVETPVVFFETELEQSPSFYLSQRSSGKILPHFQAVACESPQQITKGLRDYENLLQRVLFSQLKVLIEMSREGTPSLVQALPPVRSYTFMPREKKKINAKDLVGISHDDLHLPKPVLESIKPPKAQPHLKNKFLRAQKTVDDLKLMENQLKSMRNKENHRFPHIKRKFK